MTPARTLAIDLPAAAGARVRIAGWLHRRRELSSVTFLVVRDRSGLAQVVVDDEPTARAVAELPPETVVAVEGSAVANAKAPGGVEIADPTVDVLAVPAAAPPLELFRPQLNAQLPTLLDHASLTLRHPRRRAAFAIAAAAVRGFRDALAAAGFTEIHTPKIVGAATESGANVFRLDYFGRDAFLAQSPQLYKQIMVGAFERVFETGPVFRAEPHDTPRHLSQYVSLDAEVGFVADHRDVMAFARCAIAGMLEGVAAHAAGAAALLDVELPAVAQEIPAVHFREAQAIAAAATGEQLEGEPDLAPAHERALGEWALREHGSDFLFVTGYPMAKRPFYTHPDPADPTRSNSFDLLFRGIELVTGGQRLHRYEDYLAALARDGQDPAAYAGYLEAFRFGMPPHGGFAIGLERWVSRLVGAANVRETALFPRDIQRLSP